MKRIYFCFILAMLLMFGCKQNHNANDLTESMNLAAEPATAISVEINPELSVAPSELLITSNKHMKRIKSGDFSDLPDDNRLVELEEFNRVGIAKYFYSEVKELLVRAYTDPRNEFEWVEQDINGDEVSELIWREKKWLKRLLAVFAFENDEARIIFLHNGNAHNYYFLSESDPVYYVYYDCYSGIIQSNEFLFYTLDHNFKKEFVCGLYVLDVYDFSELSDEWLNNNPYIQENGIGIYYQRFYLDADGNRKNAEYISAEQFYYTFQEMAGFHFEERTDFFSH